jgi:hypothetical protein
MAPLPQEAAVFGVPLDAMVAAIGHQEMLIGIEGEAGGAVELARTIAMDTPCTDETPSRIEDRDPVQGFVRDVDMLVGIQGDSHRPHDLARFRAPGADVAQIILRQR